MSPRITRYENAPIRAITAAFLDGDTMDLELVRVLVEVELLMPVAPILVRRNVSPTRLRAWIRIGATRR